MSEYATDAEALAEHIAYCSTCADEDRNASPLGWCEEHMGPALASIRDAVRAEALEPFEALAEKWQAVLDECKASDPRWILDKGVMALDVALRELRAARLRAGGEAEPASSIADTCCGKCPGDTCYVDQVTGA